jgi:hypothetical protein
VHTLASPSAAVVQSDSPVLQLRLNACLFVLALQCVVMALPVLKFMGLGPMASWSWLWVLMPVWGPWAVLSVIMVFERLVEALQGVRNTQTQLVVSQQS